MYRSECHWWSSWHLTRTNYYWSIPQSLNETRVIHLQYLFFVMPNSHNVLIPLWRFALESTIHWRYFFTTYIHATCLGLDRLPILTDLLCIFETKFFHLLDWLDMLLSIGMSAFQCHFWHHVWANQFQCPCRSRTSLSHILVLGLSDYIRANI
jgi:hypothetical protein